MILVCFSSFDIADGCGGGLAQFFVLILYVNKHPFLCNWRDTPLNERGEKFSWPTPNLGTIFLNTYYFSKFCNFQKNLIFSPPKHTYVLKAPFRYVNSFCAQYVSSKFLDQSPRLSEAWVAIFFLTVILFILGYFTLTNIKINKFGISGFKKDLY